MVHFTRRHPQRNNNYHLCASDRSESTYDNMNSTETQEMDRDDEEGEVIYANADVIINNDGRTRVEDSDTKRLRILQNTGTDSSHYVKKYNTKRDIFRVVNKISKHFFDVCHF